MAQTVIRAASSTENIPAARRVRDVASEIDILDPSAAPLTLILNRTNSKVATNSKFEWAEKDLPARWIRLDEELDTTETAWTVVTPGGNYVSVGDLLKVMSTGEIAKVSSYGSATVINVVRAVAGTYNDKTNGAATTGVTDADVLIIGNAYAEGASSGTEKSHEESWLYNYTQIIRTPFGVTGTEDASENYTGPDLARLAKEKAIEHQIDLERTALFGQRNIDTTSTANPVRYTGGFFDFCDTESNVVDVSGVLTEPELESHLQDVFAHTGASDTRTAFCSPLLISILDQIAVAKSEMVPSNEALGMKIRQYVTSHGTLNIVKHRLLENGPNGDGYGNYMISLDTGRLKKRPLRGRDTKLRENIQANDIDGQKNEYMTEVGWEVRAPLVHGILKGATS